MTRTWDVWERRTFGHGNGTIVREKCLAICATREQAIRELVRIAGGQADDDCIADIDRSAMFIQRGSLLVGFEMVP